LQQGLGNRQNALTMEYVAFSELELLDLLREGYFHNDK
jgi:hypothetical protein